MTPTGFEYHFEYFLASLGRPRVLWEFAWKKFDLQCAYLLCTVAPCVLYNIENTIKKQSLLRKKWFFYYDPYGIRTHVIAVKGRCLNHLTKGPLNSSSWTWTNDIMINSHALYRLSYRGISALLLESYPGSFLLSRAVTSQVSSALQSLTAVFGMGTGVSSVLSPPSFLIQYYLFSYLSNTLVLIYDLSSLTWYKPNLLLVKPSTY